jgi:hypothetical protein
MRGEGGRRNSFLYFRLLVDPFAEQRGLPEAGGGGEKSYTRRGLQAPVEPLEQAGTRDKLWSCRRDEELGG